MIRAVLFDLDGTLIDTERQGVQAAIDSFEMWGIKLTTQDAESVVGKTWEKAMRELEARHPLPKPFHECLFEAQELYKKRLREELIEIEGAREAVHRLSSLYTLGLVSGSSGEDIEYALGQMGVRSLMKVVLGCESYPRSKPAPDGFLEAARILAVPPKECLVFEDSAAGIASARSAGMKVVALAAANWFGHDHAQADARLEHWNELTPEWLKAQGFRI